MKLTEYDKKLLSGEYGEAKKIAMEKTIELAEILGTDELVTVTKAHCCIGALDEFTRADSDLDHVYSTMYLGKDMKLDPMSELCHCQDDICSCDAYQWEAAQQTKEFFDHNKRLLDRGSELGVARASTCAPYLTGWLPLMGEIFVTTESSNVLMCNSIFGARGNGGGLGTTVWAMLTGRTPKWGLHLDENRHGTHVFNIKCRSHTRQDWDMMGYAIGSRLAPNAIPVLRGDFERPDIVKLKTFFTTLATTSGAEMCLIVGVSPEARSYEDAMKGHEPVAEFDITDDMLDGYIKFLSCQESGPIDFMQIGCPHCTLEELNRFARYMKGKKVNPNVRAYIYTTISTLQMAEVGGIAKILRDAGIQLMTSGCVNTTLHLTDGAKGVALSAGKLTHYQRSELPDSRIYYGTDEQVLDAAVAGYWEVK